ncbi:DUF7513 family protein [Wenzhouxiangella sp. EGI_FJ10305]|uniref:DUF7513 family protein n=1 Tax=Wenzhouxiangella sp. EGI_FJ10305 TaxID=3243768 RepID=UPI0035D82F88
MSLFKTWTFRSAHPTFEAGEEINAYLTTIDADTGRAEARIGDSILEVSGAKPEQLDQLVMLKVQSFDTQSHRGQAQIID